jgi:tetratricopeptide (TPR) repeat protein
MPRLVAIALVLTVVTVAVYAQVHDFEFVALDDDVYVAENETVRGGFTANGVRWALTTWHQGNWHPLTWLAHMLDCELWNLDAGRHHLSSVAWHVVNTLLLLILLAAATGRLWPSAAVAALFALHPVNVESVAWVAERKNLLSTAFGLMSMLAYVAWARRGGAWRHGLSVLCLALGLMAKPMLVTVPVLLLLLDYWPLDRVRPGHVTRLLVEKLPFLGLALASSVVTFAAQSAGGAVVTLTGELPLAPRAANAIVSCARYLRKLVWPDDLAVHYQHPQAPGGVPWTGWEVLGATVVLVALSVVVWRLSRRRYLAVGWLWFLITLVPVIGLVQVGEQAMADRYAYLPAIGVFIALAWATGDLLSDRRASIRTLGTGVACAIIGTYAVASWHQARYWHDSVALLKRGLAISSHSPTLHFNLGTVYESQARFPEASLHYLRALELGPETAKVHWGLANAWHEQGRTDQAIEHYRRALSLDPGIAAVHHGLADTLRSRGDLVGAIAHYERALQISPDLARARNNLGNALLDAGAIDRAIEEFREVLKQDASMPEAHQNLGAALMRRAEAEQALGHFREAARLRPDWYLPLGSAARILATHPDRALHDPGEAVALARKALALTHDRDPWALDTLAIAYAADGRFPEAVRTATVALELASTTGATGLAEDIRSRLERYRREELP